jgi:hypothetical protein
MVEDFMKNKKRLILIALMAVAAVTAYAQQYDSESDYKADIIDGGKSVMITGYVGLKQTVRIPPTIKGLPVIHISRAAFKGKNITSVAIPDGVTVIWHEAFYNCASLVSVTIPTSVNIINASAFSKCTSLKSVIIPNGVTSMQDNIFSGYTSLTSVTIPTSVTAIWDYVFSDCTSLASVTIPNNVKYIGKNAFSGCTNLTSVNIPASVTMIENKAFAKCAKLTSITIPASVTVIGYEAFDGCVSLTSVTFQGTIISKNFGEDSSVDDFDIELLFRTPDPPFPGDLKEKYLAGGIGRYTRASGGTTWTKQK